MQRLVGTVEDEPCQDGPMPFRPSRRGLVPPFIAMDVLRAANEREAAGHSVIHLEVGQPGTPAPETVLDAARRAVAKDRIGYTDALGIAPLRAAIARHYREQYGVAVEPADIVVTTGSSAAFQLAFLAAFEPGDRVALAAPGYPAYRNILTALDLEPVLIEVGENAHYQPNPELLAEAGDLAGLIVASPANPTGTMIPAAALERLSEYCRERQIRLVSDEIYHGITYEETPQTARAFGDDAIVVNSFSILQHDRLAARLDGRAAGFEALGRMPGAEFLHLAAGPVAARGDPGVRLPRRIGRPCRALPRQSRPPDRNDAVSRPHPFRAGRGRLLPLCRCLVTDPRQRRILPAYARRDRGR